MVQALKCPAGPHLPHHQAWEAGSLKKLLEPEGWQLEYTWATGLSQVWMGRHGLVGAERRRWWRLSHLWVPDHPQPHSPHACQLVPCIL